MIPTLIRNISPVPRLPHCAIQMSAAGSVAQKATRKNLTTFGKRVVDAALLKGSDKGVLGMGDLLKKMKKKTLEPAQGRPLMFRIRVCV